MVQALGVFTDTLLVCSCTAFIIIISGIYDQGDLSGIQLTQGALQYEIGSVGPTFVAVAIFLFAFSSIIGNYTYGEMNVRFLTRNKKWLLATRIMNAVVMVFFGAIASLDLVWNLGDLFMGFVTICNLVAIVSLGKHVFFLLDDYRKQKRLASRVLSFIVLKCQKLRKISVVGISSLISRVEIFIEALFKAYFDNKPYSLQV